MSLPQPAARISAFEKMGFGMFIHWGLYSQLGAGEWVQDFRQIPFGEYKKLAETFTACDFDPDAIAALAAKTGMKYIVLTTRHHDGFSLYDTCGLNDFDAPHTPAKRDLIAEYVEACRRHGIVPFFYHTTMDWYWRGKNTVRDDSRFSVYTKVCCEEEFQEYLEYLYASVELLCKNYGKIGGLWFDGNWSRPNSDWQEDRLYGMIRKHQPEAIIVNNTGLVALGKMGHPEIDSVTYENNAAKPMDREGMEKYVAAEVCKTMNAHWGLGKADINFLSPVQVVERLCHSRGCGANFLLNFGPTPQGGIPEYEKAVLNLVSRWMEWFGEAIYDPKPDTSLKCQGRDILLRNGKNLYYFAHDLGISGLANVTVGLQGPGLRTIDNLKEKILSAHWMDNNEAIDFTQDLNTGITAVRCTGFPYGTHTGVRVMKITLE
ncbi:MAG: alpha-L-fucosidase [Lentisphaeria bacterium]|nr:alpha-L-fucosidase [Lentisphaeria bacterium]